MTQNPNNSGQPQDQPPNYSQPPNYGQPPNYNQQPNYGQQPNYSQPPNYGQPPYYAPGQPEPKRGGFPVWTLIIIIPLTLVFACGLISWILLHAAGNAVNNVLSTAERSYTVSSMSGTVGSAATVTPISRSLNVVPQRSFTYADMQFVVTKGEITNRVSATSDYYRADAASLILNLGITNQGKDYVSLGSGQFRLTTGDGKVYKQTADLSVGARDTEDYKLTFSVPTTTMWDKAVLAFDEQTGNGTTVTATLNLDGAPTPAQTAQKIAASAEISLTQPSKATYKLTEGLISFDAFGKRAVSGKRFLLLSFSVTGNDKYSTYVGKENFRLVINGTPMSPTELSPIAEVVGENETKDFKLAFLIPNNATNVELEVGETGKETKKITLTLPAGN